MSQQVTFRVNRTTLRLIIVVLTTAALVAPVAAWAGHQFSDVSNSQTFHDDIDWMADNRITRGCGEGVYCPDDPVTRGQMAAFMRRLATGGAVEKLRLETKTLTSRLPSTHLRCDSFDAQVLSSGVQFASNSSRLLVSSYPSNTYSWTFEVTSPPRDSFQDSWTAYIICLEPSS